MCNGYCMILVVIFVYGNTIVLFCSTHSWFWTCGCQMNFFFPHYYLRIPINSALLLLSSIIQKVIRVWCVWLFVDVMYRLPGIKHIKLYEWVWAVNLYLNNFASVHNKCTRQEYPRTYKSVAFMFTSPRGKINFGIIFTVVLRWNVLIN